MASQLMWTLTARTTPLSGQMMRAAASKSKHLRDLLPATTSARSASTASDVDSIPTEKRVVIIGGGVIGCSVAYNLGKLGWGKDTLLLEQNKLTSGTTWHAAGLIGTARATEAETSLSVAGLRTVKSIHEETGQSTGYKQCGSLNVARTPERMTVLRRTADRIRSFGLEAQIVDAKTCGELYNGIIRTEDLEGGIWLPEDGSASPTDLTMAYAAGARNSGAKLVENCGVDKINVVFDPRTGSRRATGVTLLTGEVIEAEKVVLCAGQWSKQVGGMAGANVPLHSAEHYYIITEPMDGVTTDLPVLRDADAYIYAREWSGGLCVGGFEPEAKAAFEGYSGVPRDFAFQLFPDDYDQFDILYQGAMERIPQLETVGVNTFLNGPESFTSDAHYLLGETPDVSSLFVCSGMNSSGIASSGGAGKATAEWIVNGEPTQDLWAVDIRRHHKAFTSSPLFLRDRISETLGLHYAMPWPRKELHSCRGMRRSPIYSELADAGAVWGQRSAWERPSYFVPPPARPEEFAEPGTFGMPKYNSLVAQESNFCRNSVALFDLTSFSKYSVAGPDALAVMQRLCCANMDVEPGSIVYTGMLNQRGGYEADVTATRLSEREFSVVSATAQATKDLSWIRGHIDGSEGCVATDVTSGFSVLAVMGPRSRCILEACSYYDFSPENFAFGRARDVDIGPVMVNARRVTYVGELGWELYIPSEATSCVLEVLQTACEQTLGASRAEGKWGLGGYYAIDALRMEKGYRAWGHELGPDVSPIEAGLAFTIDGDKEFIGSDAVRRKQEKRANGELSERVVSFVGTEPPNNKNIAWGGEPIFLNGEIVGRATSAGHGFSLDRCVGLGIIRHPDVFQKGFLTKSGSFELGVAGELMPLKLSLRAPWDPKNASVHSVWE